MTKYLLLRDNKESGPYSFDDLKAKGLKAYDLVWVDGRSAAWRYPCEIEELRPFSPVVEEQPFDRFYKKPSTQSNPVHATTIPSAPSPTPAPAAAPAILTGEPSMIPGKRIIYVTLPAGKGPAVLRESVVREPARSPAPVAGRTTPSNDFTPPAPERPLSADAIPGAGPLPAEDNFAHPREDWKTAVEITPRTRRSGLSRILQPVAAILCILALLAAGIFIGLSINKSSFGMTQKFASKDLTANRTSSPEPAQTSQTAIALPVSAPATQEPAATDPAAKSGADNAGGSAAERTTAAGPSSSGTVPPAIIKTSEPAAGKSPRTNSSREKIKASASQAFASTSAQAKDSAISALPVMHRDATRRTDGSPDKDAIKNNISNLVSVGGNNYTVGTFGGISDVQVTVSNRSVYPLDLVVVEVQYIQANKKVFKTENLYFRGIGAGSALMLEAPKSTRGIKVQYKITLINSKELGLSYSAI